MDLDSQAFMKNLLGIQPNAFEPVYSEDEHVSGSEDSELEGNSDSETQTAVDVKYMCLRLRGNVSFDIDEIFWRKNLMLKILTVKYNFSIGNLLCCIHALA